MAKLHQQHRSTGQRPASTRSLTTNPPMLLPRPRWGFVRLNSTLGHGRGNARHPCRPQSAKARYTGKRVRRRRPRARTVMQVGILANALPERSIRGKPKAHSHECASVFQESEMQTHDFFTRMIAMSCVGSNAPNDPAKNGKLKKIYICGACEKSHKFESEAEECCQPTVYSQYECPSCSESHETESEAFSCCAYFQPKRCPICLKKAQSYEDAADCCLHTHPSMSAAGRDRVAKAVAGGMPWPDAVAANINH